jgi:cobalt-zinc-cadmium resistance protein CzcA
VLQNPLLGYYSQEVKVAGAQTRLERNKLWPDLSLGYYNQYLIPAFDPAGIDRKYTPGTRIAGFEIGVSIPLFFGAQAARIRASGIQQEIARTMLEHAGNNLKKNYDQTVRQYLRLQQSVHYYETAGLKLADELLKVSRLSYEKGEMGYVEYVRNISQSLDTKLQYLETLNQYNQAVIRLNYLKGGK